MTDQTRLDTLLVRYEELRAQDTPVSADELCAHCPELLAELKRQIQDLESMNALLGGTGSQEASAASTRPDPAGPGLSESRPAEALCTGSRYQVLRFHAKGGLGEVEVARDEELHRDVALKRLQALHARNPHSRSRFLREAEITSRLEHPNIVPVHGMGQDAEGRPFYAMRFIQGQTLQEAIHQFHATDKPSRAPGERRLALRQLVSRFVAVCNTIAYAHSKGIVHRDIKPGNIMLGPYGETLVVDWGLAKDMGARDSESARPQQAAVSSEIVAPTLPPAHAPTQIGVVMGTLAYMSPEQAEGRWDLVGPASDVYGLGAALYVLLTGQPPFQGSQERQVLDKVKRGEFLPPRQRKKDVPRALEAICLKAMARQPDERYATALEIAVDLEHWLADEPVSAWPEPWTVRSRRWLGRHRTLMTSAVAVVVVAAAGLAVGLVLLAAAKEQADENFKLARRAVEQFFTGVSEDPRLREYGLEDFRKEQLRAAAEFYEKFVQQRSSDPDVLADQARAYRSLGFITQETASKEEAINLYQEALNICDRLARAYPSQPQYRQGLAQSHYSLGRLNLDTGRPGQAKEHLEKALQLREDLARVYLDDADYQNDLAQSHHGLANLYHSRHQLSEAEASYMKAMGLRKELVGAHPAVTAYRTGLADIHLNLGRLHRFSWPLERVEDEFLQSMKIWEKLVEEYPTVSEYQAKQSYVINNLGALYSDPRPRKETDASFKETLDIRAEASFKKALEIRERMASAHPTVNEYRSKWGVGYHNLGAFYADTNRPALAEPALRKGMEIHEKLVRDYPDVTAYAMDLGRSYGRLGHLMRVSNPQAALDWSNQAVRTHGAVRQKEPQHAEARLYLGYDHRGRALILTRLTRYAEALEDWDRALELDEGKNHDEWCLGRAVTLARAGEHARATAEADTVAEKARTAKRANRSRLYDAACVYSLSSVAARQETERAERYAARAVQLLEQAHQAGHFQTPAKMEQLQKDPNLDPLRQRESFKKLLNELQDTAKTGAK